ncbi:MAG TPA: DEAD/DEAH box helicase [candidate division WOR-3 bacterium]|uniref:DEAD/DEAH box helicase n=1 Tax=candidate division WOR-3 bacterium TaxID=2052148 RepID=A0A9C9JZ89_UNCW3|nr:DEAD/DEAH box helicase [candidate division WOR-3 bacterium]
MNGQEIKARLTRTWHPFFSRFGKFLPIQELVIPHILACENTVVISPAASGKTEAVIAPLIENLFRDDSTPLRGVLKILYISPTRALVNDLFKRLFSPVEYSGLTLGRKTGDRPTLDYKNLPQILLTTPESFDSLLTRRPRIFLDLYAVVLDEIHLLDNTPRGDQLRVLLNRLRRIRKELHYCALSATIDDLHIGERYFDSPKVCLLKQRREIEYDLISGKEFTGKFFEIVKKRGFKKILVFFNARSLAEIFSRRLNRPPFQNAVFVHHASLQKLRREEVEEEMNRSERAVLCATSTLELGIDIGDIDCVVLYRPPYDVSSLLQRIGRGNRRTDRLFAIGVYTDAWEKLLFETFFECAWSGRLFDRQYRVSLSVIPQQIYSYLYQRRRIGTTIRSLYNVLEPIFTKEQIRAVFQRLLKDGKVQEGRPGIYYDSSKMEKKIERGKIHSNIAEISFGEFDVFNLETDELIGRVFYVKKRFILGGRCWETVRVRDKKKKIYARLLGDMDGAVKIFEGKGEGNYNYLLSPLLKKKLFPELPLLEFPFSSDGSNTYILHLFGSLYGFITAEALYEEGIDAVDIDGRVFLLKAFQTVDDRFPLPKVESIKIVIKRNISRLEDALGSGAYFYDLPVKYQIEDHYSTLDIEGFLEFLSRIRLSYVERDRLRIRFS